LITTTSDLYIAYDRHLIALLVWKWC